MKIPSFAALAIFLLASTGPARAAQIVAVDLGRNGQAVEAGYIGFSTDGSASAPIDPQPFSGGTWDIESTLGNITRSYGDITTTPLGDLLEDSFLVNTSGSGGYFELIFDGLLPGDYQLTTYHHSFAFGGATAEVLGALEGDALASLGYVASTTGTSISNFATLSVAFTATAAKDGYVLRFRPTNAAGSFHFDFSGFTLEGTPAQAVPAMSASGYALLGAILCGVGLYAGQRRRSFSG